MKSLILSLAIGGLPLAILLFIAYLRRRWKRARFKTPLTAKLLRPPGESLRLEILRLNERIDDGLICFLLICTAIGASVWVVPPEQNTIGLSIIAIALAIGYLVCFTLGSRLFRVLRLKHDYELGFIGERAVGEELNQMMARGYAVFHDVQFEGRPGSKNFNIDHVAVGPGGVFAVETKTRRKQSKNGKAAPNVVTFDGLRLNFPWGSDDFGIKQARENAKILGNWLQKAIGDEVEVVPILALPGWSVERRGWGDVRVVSGREICSTFPKMDSNPVLTVNKIKQISFQLEQRCRNIDVE